MTSTSSQRYYLQAMHACFQAAVASGARQRSVMLEVDGTVLQLVCAGEDIAGATVPALALLAASPNADPTFTVELWDSGSVDVRPPAPPWGKGDGGPHGVVRGYNDDTFKTVVDRASGVITACDLSEGLAVVWAARAVSLPDWWRALPLRLLLGWVLARPGRHLVHAGAVGAEGRGVLLAGRGGAGKSTTAVACVEAGMDYAGDDYVLLSAGEPARAHALYSTAKLDRRSLALLPQFASSAVFRDGDKAVLNLHALRPGRLCPALSVEAIVMPRFEGGTRTALRRIPRAAALRTLAASTVFQAPDGGEQAMDVLASVVRSVPAFELQIGRDPSSAADRIRSVLEAEL